MKRKPRTKQIRTVKPRRGGTITRIYGRVDENGKRLCCVCGKPVTGKRRDWCGKGCVDRFTNDCDWKVIRNTILTRDDWTCQLCGVEVFDRGRPNSPRKAEVDHIHRVADGGTNHHDNLRTLCRQCHAHVTATSRRKKSVIA